MKKQLLVALVLLVTAFSCKKNTEEIKEPVSRNLIDAGILSRTEVGLTLPTGIDPAAWRNTSVKLILKNGITVYKTGSLTEPNKSINVYRFAGKDATSISTFKPAGNDLSKFSLSSLSGEKQLEFSVRKDGAFGDFHTFGESQRTVVECMKALVNQCMDSWGCSFLLIIMAEEIGIAMTAQCVWQVGHEKPAAN